MSRSSAEQFEQRNPKSLHQIKAGKLPSLLPSPLEIEIRIKAAPNQIRNRNAQRGSQFEAIKSHPSRPKKETERVERQP